MIEPKDSHSSKSDKICTVDFITGKVETLGSTFSNETPKVAACVLMLLCKIHYHLKRPLIYDRTQRFS